jgi:hypothetical protein
MVFLAIWLGVAATLFGAVIGRAYERRAWQRRLPGRVDLSVDEPKRLSDAAGGARRLSGTDPEQVAQALDAIAIEVERIGEGQRFLTKVLAERDLRPGVKPVSPIPGAVRSPLPPTA